MNKYKIKENLIKLIKFQINSLIGVTIRTTSIYFFSDYLKFDYNLIFWISLIVVMFSSFNIQKKFVFDVNNPNSFSRFVLSTALFGTLEFFVSMILKLYTQYYFVAFLASGVIIFLLRFFFNKNYVFRKRNN